jgi:hypothetical protein
MVKFVQEHYEQPGIDYVKDWLGLVVEKTLDSNGILEELHIFWEHGGSVSDYPSSWWNKLSYFPFEVISESR